jgi:tetratricopeptide (TPR) repeat protein
MTARAVGFGALAVLIATALVGDPAWAQRASDRGQAAGHVRQGQAFFQRGDFDRALVEYQAAFDLSAEPSLIFNIALCHDRASRPEPALAAFRRYLALAPDGIVADEARADIARLTPIVERIVADRTAHEERLREQAAQETARRQEAAKREELAAAHRTTVSRYVIVAGAVVAAAGAVPHALAWRTIRRLPDEPDHDSYLADRRSAEIERGIAIGAYAAGAITIATGIVLAYTARGLRDGPQLSATILPGGAAVVFAWSR